MASLRGLAPRLLLPCTRTLTAQTQLKSASHTKSVCSKLEVMADDSPIAVALGLKTPGPGRHWSFQVSDTVLTAAMLAGGADSIHKAMDAFRKFMEASSAKASGMMK